MNCFAGLLNFLLYVVNIVFLVSLPIDHASDNYKKKYAKINLIQNSKFTYPNHYLLWKSLENM